MASMRGTVSATVGKPAVRKVTKTGSFCGGAGRQQQRGADGKIDERTSFSLAAKVALRCADIFQKCLLG